MRHVIIGNGIAGVSAAEAIRKLDHAADITMVGDEAAPPYSRPMIGMVLDGSVPIEKLAVRSPEFYESLGITPELGHRVTAIDVDLKRVRVRDDRWLPYDRLLIASGADPRPIDATGAHLKNIFYMRTQAQAKEQIDAVANAGNALVLGGGLVGFKAAYGLLSRGLDVTMLIFSDYPLSQQVDPFAGRMILKELSSHGLKVHVGLDVTGFEGRDTVSGAVLSDGTRLACDMVVIGKGVLPALSFVPRERIPVDLGILVDQYLETGAPDVFAAGDAAESIDIARRTRWVNAIWPEAVDQGRIAGANMAGRHVAYRGSLSRNVMRVYGVDVMTMGWVDPPAEADLEVLSTYRPGRRAYRKLVFREDVLIGACLINDIEQGGLLLSLIRNETPTGESKERMLSPSFNFGSLLPGRC